LRNPALRLQYGTIGTEEKYFLKWKEDEEDNSRFKLDKYLLKMCEKRRLIELMHDFVLFDGGVKKLPRVHQYFGVKAAQEHARQRKGGIVWHTQGSGKSIVMVLLAKWILENNPDARVAIITDRDGEWRPDVVSGEPLSDVSSDEQAIPRKKIVIALDTYKGKIATQGWRKYISLCPEQVMAALEPFCCAFLCTDVDREGTLSGANLKHFASLRATR